MIIEKDNQLDDFLLENQNKDCFIIPILSDVNRHPLDNSLCAIYVKIVDGEEGLLCFNHGEALKLSLKKLLTINKFGSIFVHDKKDIETLKEQNYVGFNKGDLWMRSTGNLEFDEKYKG